MNGQDSRHRQRARSLPALAFVASALLVLSGCGSSPLEEPGGTSTLSSSGPTIDIVVPPGLVKVDLIAVVDGDTVRVRLNGEAELVRMIGVDAPEAGGPYRNRECYGQEATEFLRDAAPIGSVVYLERDHSDRDRFDRLLRYIWQSTPDGEFLLLNQVMIAHGAARQRAYPPDTRYQATLESAEDMASRRGEGLWRDC